LPLPIRNCDQELCKRTSTTELAVAVRSSATAEDLPEASFAGQQESYLNIRGIDALIEACHLCTTSPYTDRAIAYREEKGFANQPISLSLGTCFHRSGNVLLSGNSN